MSTIQPIKPVIAQRGLRTFIVESNRIEGIRRTPTAIEIAAHEGFLDLEIVTVGALRAFVAAICGAPIRDTPGMDVRVGSRRPPPGAPAIITELAALLAAANRRQISPYDAHVRYESLHPFMDGNGRSGRVLWLWMQSGDAPLGFLHTFYYQALEASQRSEEQHPRARDPL